MSSARVAVVRTQPCWAQRRKAHVVLAPENVSRELAVPIRTLVVMMLGLRCLWSRRAQLLRELRYVD
jgi:hypothetical protein